MHVEGVLANNDYILNGCYIEITSNCNLRCIHCYNESGELRDQISVEAFKNVLGCYDNPKKASITLSGGEPLLHPQVWKFIDMMLESGILARNILLITNATCITDDVANMLAEKHVSVQVSLNGSRAELHDSICGKGNFERTMAGCIVHYREPPVYALQSVSCRRDVLCFAYQYDRNPEVLMDYRP